MSKPLVSVIMAAYNAQEFLNIAIDSILLQTYKNLELIVIDDGSTDHTASIIKAYSDPRLKYFHQKNQGLAAALNAGIKKASGKYIARMDADDISEPKRLEKQVALLEKNEDLGMVGTSFYLIDENGSYLDRSYHLDRPEDLRLEIFVRNPFGHGTMLIRASALPDGPVYDESEAIEDYELWWRLIQKVKASNLTSDLYSWRVVASGMSHGASDKRQKPLHDLMVRIWQEGQPPNPSIRQIKSGLRHYQALGGGYEEQYRYMLAAACLGAQKVGKRYYASSLLAKLLFIDPAFRYTILSLRKDPRSHNYNLSNLYR